VRYKYAMSGPRAPRTFGEWVEAYEERDGCKYVLSPGEEVRYEPGHGFFTYYFDAGEGQLIIPKMCGDGRHWRPVLLMLLLCTRHLGIRRLYCCTKRNPGAFVRAFGGEVVAMDYSCDFETGKSLTLWYIAATPQNLKGGQADGRAF
jgi:hypothetical protein